MCSQPQLFMNSSFGVFQSVVSVTSFSNHSIDVSIKREPNKDCFILPQVLCAAGAVGLLPNENSISFSTLFQRRWHPD